MSSTRSYADPRWFYCHQCTHRWLKSHNSIFECPRCRQGFIEEVTDDFNPNIPFFPAPPSPLRYILYDAFNESNEEDARSRNRARRNRTDRTEQANNRLPSTSRSRSPHISNIVIGTGGNREGNRNDQNFRIIFNTRQGEANRFLSVAIDDIMNSLFTSERQPAMTDEQLNEIPLATITAAQVEAQLQCAICFEDYQVNENEVRKLLCNHFFHEKCIFPWLRNNASCPVCRTSLASENDSDEEVANFVQFITNSRRARMNPNNTENEPGPSTSQSNRSVPQASTSSNVGSRIPVSQLSRIPRISRRVENPQVNPIASTRIRSRNLQINQNEPPPHLRPQNMTIRGGDINSRINAPISSRTRSQHNSSIIEPRNPPNSREIRNGQRNGLSRIRHIPRPQRSALTHSDNNNEEPPQPRSRRRRIPFYSPPPLTVRNSQRSFVNYQELLRRIEDDSDSSSSRDTFDSPPLSVSDPEIVQISPQSSILISQDNTRHGTTAAEPLRVDISDDSD
ncbi:E3 ubiquitin-protein ligase Iruka-like [Chironomus tepperi]|uniref:E3 ubiquitin-protein ligase Iruka-like n=1 Tax=Chironomus tepperi TaxID=113505 RepID=UPI00391EF7B0